MVDGIDMLRLMSSPIVIDKVMLAVRVCEAGLLEDGVIYLVESSCCFSEFDGLKAFAGA